MTESADPSRDQHPGLVLAVPHPGPLVLRGAVLACAACGAERDWLLIHVQPELVFVRCRCTHEWREHDLEADHVAAARGEGAGERSWESIEQMYRGLGYDGLLAGTYFG
ncbi:MULTISPECIES: hypothetical protein [Kitasatospora]|uniref:Uncharacterized protein n=1 Tax=Kitasatospora setae (strain ATCC 33774 / DSM 43861 / JCM 3304 / KCC A-0304 / NBRC 14216 / KM-6054) TaxID=452652 RepID=E4ND04_KITSK|nr:MULTISPECIES: hypothetical protein [Kitasatospora]BAJ29085.1 hypothetical protein KSE_32760 [Kitasatospora setae KM-6054]